MSLKTTDSFEKKKQTTTQDIPVNSYPQKKEYTVVRGKTIHKLRMFINLFSIEISQILL